MTITRADLELQLAEAKALAKEARRQKIEAEEAGDGDAHALALEAIDAAVATEERTRIALAIFDGTGSEYGVVVMDDRVVGTVAVALPPGTSREVREKRIDAVLGELLLGAASSADAVLATSPSRFVIERPGRDAEGRTVLDVRGKLEGGRVVPALRPPKH
jgi:hypothetical protein